MQANISTILPFVVELDLIAPPMTLLITSGAFDHSACSAPGMRRLVRGVRGFAHGCISNTHNVHSALRMVRHVAALRHGGTAPDTIDPRHVSIEEAEPTITGMQNDVF